jgi:hypothetical protein
MTDRECYVVAVAGRRYVAYRMGGDPHEVFVCVGRFDRMLWASYRSDDAPKGRAAEVLACVDNPDYAAKMGAVVVRTA